MIAEHYAEVVCVDVLDVGFGVGLWVGRLWRHSLLCLHFRFFLADGTLLEHVAEKLDDVVGDEFELCQRSFHFNHYAVYGGRPCGV